MLQRWAVVCWTLAALAGALQCPDGRSCQTGQTCCSSPADGFGCCPLDQAQCCSDHLHCCPADTVCQPSTSSCVNATASVSWVRRVPAERPEMSTSFRMIQMNTRQEDDTICPDQSRCPAEYSCVQTPSRFSCCPLPQGVSCSDGRHCCPDGNQCSADSRSCFREDGEVTNEFRPEKVPERSTAGVPPSEKEVLVSTATATGTIVQCDDTVACPDSTTCCKTKDGGWGCCPLPKAVCCSDFEHCCPSGQTCNLAEQKCDSGLQSEPWVEKIPAIRVEVVQCDQTTACPDSTTCCKTKEGDWGCCPLPKAVCCDDHETCCPEGSTCNPTAQTCDSALGSTPMRQKFPAFVHKTLVAPTPVLRPQTHGDVQCDQTSKCPDGDTCCRTSSTTWGCCPSPNAVCCSDMLHCCPSGFTCTDAGQCIQSAAFDWRLLLGNRNRPQTV